MSCICATCVRTYEYDHRKGHTKRLCNSCQANRRVSRTELKRQMVEYKGGRCQVCGYDRCLRSLCFHHLDCKTKGFAFAGSHCLSRASIWQELDKCVLLCQNCHGEVHDALIGLSDARLQSPLGLKVNAR